MQSSNRTYRTAELIDSGKLSIGDGYRAKNSELSDTGLPFARVGNIQNGFQFESADRFSEDDLHKVGDKISRPGDVVFTSKGTVGRFAFVTPEVPRFVYSPQLTYWRSLDPDLIDPRYLYYWMHGTEFWLQASGVKGQTDMADYVSLADQRQMTISLAHPSEQRAIASVLGALDDKIELNRQMNRTLEEMAAALFKSWFVDFDPVHAKLARRSLGEGGAEGRRPFGMDDETAALFPDRFVETEEGLVPEGWKVLTLPEFMEINPKRVLGKGVEASYVPMTAAPTSGHAPSVVETRAKGSGATFVNGDTLLAKITPCLENGKTVYVDCLTDGEVGWGSTEFIVLRPHTPWPEAFGYVLARYPEFRAHAEKSMTGTSGRQRVQLDDLKQFRQVLPTDGSVPVAFGDLITPLFDLAGRNAKEATTLADLRDTLLPKLLSGEIRLKQAEKAVEEAI